jgi:ubiquitin fusion degradation protein 1
MSESDQDPTDPSSDEDEDYQPRYISELTCFSISLMPGQERSDLENGGKIIMPPSVLRTWNYFNLPYPMLFKLTNQKANRITHAGVLEFLAEEGNVYLPSWMMNNLKLQEGDTVRVQSVSLPIGTYTKFQVNTPDFLNISNFKAVLEKNLRSFSCLTKDDNIAVSYNEKSYELNVLETKPGDAINIIECDLSVDFVESPGVASSKTQEKNEEKCGEEEKKEPEKKAIGLFEGQGNRLDGKRVREPDPEDTDEPKPKRPKIRGQPDYEHDLKHLVFFHDVEK